MRKSILKKDKKGVSNIIGYLLLVSMGLVMAIVGYNYLKTYVPKDIVECPTGTSVFIKEYSYDGTGLDLTIKNNGKFDFAGYYIHGTESADREVATINLAHYFTGSSDGEGMTQQDNSYIVFSADGEGIKPGESRIHSFYLSGLNIEAIQITPVRYEEDGENLKFISCSNSKTRESLVIN